MTRFWKIFGWSCLTSVCATTWTGAAQPGGAPQAQAAAAQATGSVSGRVVCSDTQRPARFAEVTIIPVSDASGGDEGFTGGRGRRGSARTDLDGNYVVTNLPPGAYYAMAQATGYVSTMAAIAARASSSADAAALMAQLPQVQVGTGTSTANLSLERGSVIAGRVLWDDGSAAAGVNVNAVSSTATSPLGGARGPQGLGQFGLAGGGSGSLAQTDDRGSFRLTGLAPGEYLVRANFAAPAPVAVSGPGGPGFAGPVGGRTIPITLYAPGKMRKAEAQTVKLSLGEERGDVVFTADLRALHNVAGRVSSASDTAVHSGSVRLTDSQDSTLSRNTQINADGTFTVAYVPVGTYTLSINASSATQGGGFGRGRGGAAIGTTPTVTFQPLQETLTVTDADISGVNVTVTPQTAAASTSAAGR